jgi:hypothetical protein
VIRFQYITLPFIAATLVIIIGLSSFSEANKSTNVTVPEVTSWKLQLTESAGISQAAFDLSLQGYIQLSQQKQLTNDSLLAIIDFSKPSYEKRLYIIDIKNKRLVKQTYVAHGVNSGELVPESFSNAINSNKSSLGLFVTQNTYQGKHGYSLRIQGLNEGLNDNAYKRAVVIHGADYVSQDYIKRNGRLGRSFGCPALPEDETKEVIDLIKNGACLFIYHPNLLAKSQPAQGIL